jgi:hypothetical protein
MDGLRPVNGPQRSFLCAFLSGVAIHSPVNLSLAGDEPPTSFLETIATARGEGRDIWVTDVNLAKGAHPFQRHRQARLLLDQRNWGKRGTVPLYRESRALVEKLLRIPATPFESKCLRARLHWS